MCEMQFKPTGVLQEMEVLAVQTMASIVDGSVRFRMSRSRLNNQTRIRNAERVLLAGGPMIDFISSVSHTMENVLNEAFNVVERRLALQEPAPLLPPPPPPPPAGPAPPVAGLPAAGQGGPPSPPPVPQEGVPLGESCYLLTVIESALIFILNFLFSIFFQIH